MSKKVEKILVLADNFEQKAAESLVAEAKKKDSKKNSKQDSKKDSKKSDLKSKLKDSKKKVKKSFLDTYEGLIYKFGQAQQVQQPDGTWVAADDDTDVTDGQKVRKWNGTKWETFKYRAVDQALVPEQWDYGQPGKVTHNPTPQTDQDAKNFMAGKGAPRGAGGGGGAGTDTSKAPDAALVGKMQEFLNKNKFNAGPVDNKLGPQTAGALKRWQKSVGLPETGQMDQATFAKLADSIPEFKQMMNASKGITKAPISAERASALVDQHESDMQDYLKTYQSGEMTASQQNKQMYLASMSKSYKNAYTLWQQLSGLMQSPQIDPDQKKELEPISNKLNGVMMAYWQYMQILQSPAQQAPGQQPGQPPAAAPQGQPPRQ